jgi:orotidine-5'-phosphate decarboxylase
MIKNIPIDKRIIFALDVESGDEAKKWIYLLSDTVKFFKIGLELFVNSGSSVVDEVLKRECEVMLDLKLYDIPKTVYRTVKQIVKRDISFLTVHGNMEILKAAVDAASFSNVGILGVTVLTSFDEKDLRQMGYPIS